MGGEKLKMAFNLLAQNGAGNSIGRVLEIAKL